MDGTEEGILCGRKLMI